MSIVTTDIGDLEEFLRATLTADEQLVALLGGEHFYAYQAQPNDEGGMKAVVVYTIIPLNDKQGQTRRINSKAFVDLKVVIDGAPTDATEAMVARIDELFSYVVKQRAGNHSFSSRGERPISYREPGLQAEKYFFNRGRQYRFWITAAL